MGEHCVDVARVRGSIPLAPICSYVLSFGVVYEKAILFDNDTHPFI